MIAKKYKISVLNNSGPISFNRAFKTLEEHSNLIKEIEEAIEQQKTVTIFGSINDDYSIVINGKYVTSFKYSK